MTEPCTHVFPDGDLCRLADHSAPGLRELHGLPPKVKYDGGHPSYDLLVKGEVVGTVTYYEKRYNLRRVIVDKGWTARSLDGQHAAGSDMTDTRRSAVQALLAKMGIEAIA